jgi:transposase
MALSDDLRERVVHAVTHSGMSRNAAAKRFGVSIASAVRWLQRFGATGGFRRLRRVAIAGRNVLRRNAIICSVWFAGSRT